MPSLGTTASRLQNINRQRSLADALQQSAISFQPIQHPFQGLAKLAQALVSNQINRRATTSEEELAEAQRQQLANALNPVTVGKAAPSNITLEGFDDVPAETIQRPGAFLTRGKTPEELLQSLPPELGQQVLGNVIQSRLTAQQNQQPPALQDFAAEIDFDGNGNFVEGRVMFNPDPNNPGILAITDQGLVPLNSNQVRDPIKRTQELPFNPKSDLFDTFTQAQVVMGQFDRLGENILAGGLATVENPVGAFRSTIEGTVEGVKALAQTLKLPFADEAARADQSTLFNLERRKSGDQIQLTESDLRKYSDQQIAANRSAWERFIALDAKTQQLGISIAYTLARIADPGGRLSEMDVLNQIRALGLGATSKTARIAAINEARTTFADTVLAQLDFSRANGVDFNLPQGFEARMREIQSGSDVIGGNATSTPTVIISDAGQSAWEGIMAMPRGSAVQRQAMENFRRQFPDDWAVISREIMGR